MGGLSDVGGLCDVGGLYPLRSIDISEQGGFCCVFIG